MSVAAVQDPGLETRLEELRASRGGDVPVDEVREIVEAVMGSMEGDLDATDIQLYMELESLANYIERAKHDIASLRPDEVTDEYIPSATDELDAIVGATAEATNSIMDATETIEKEIEVLPPDSAEKLMEATTQIYEACGFQDITGQRITKVVTALKEIDEKVTALVEAFGKEIDRIKSRQPDEKADDKQRPPTDEDLLHGPQLANEARTQEEIDALLASFD